jgi:hypothetical protein
MVSTLTRSKRLPQRTSLSSPKPSRPHVALRLVLRLSLGCCVTVIFRRQHLCRSRTLGRAKSPPRQTAFSGGKLRLEATWIFERLTHSTVRWRSLSASPSGARTPNPLLRPAAVAVRRPVESWAPVGRQGPVVQMSVLAESQLRQAAPARALSAEAVLAEQSSTVARLPAEPALRVAPEWAVRRLRVA